MIFIYRYLIEQYIYKYFIILLLLPAVLRRKIDKALLKPFSISYKLVGK